MDQPEESPLILGGHSFIEQLGNDPPLNADGQAELVEACLAAGIRWFDTTYQPERIALGLALERLGRRDEAKIIAWNFFHDFGPGEDVGGPDYYRPEHLDLMLGQLRTDRIDCMVVHGLSDSAKNSRQEQLAVQWQRDGRVGMLGTWTPGSAAEEHFGPGNPYAFMVSPYNVTTADAPEVFGATKRLGWRNFACSPYCRGWELDKLVARAAEREGAARCRPAPGSAALRPTRAGSGTKDKTMVLS